MRLIRIKNQCPEPLEGGVKKDSIYIQNLIKIIECKDGVVTFLHNTKTKETAERVLREGFEFQSHLDYTTDVVTAKDPITIKYFTIVRQAYGKYTLIIQISKQLIEDYSEQLNSLSHHFSEILTIKAPYLGCEDDLIYCLAPHFVKGFMDAETGEFFANPIFDASLKIPIFEENLRRILS